MAGTKRRLGAVLMGASLAGALVMAGPAMAQDEPEEVKVEVTRHALFAHPANDVIPDTVLAQFPPQVVCLVFPQACPREAAPVTDPLSEGLREVDSNQETSPLQPAQPDTVVLEMMGGTPRYSGGAAFELPEIPSEHEWDKFTLTFRETDLTYSYDSPVFRRAVMAAVSTAGSQDPAVFQAQMQKLLEEERKRLQEEEGDPLGDLQIGIEACPLTKAVPEGAEPPQSAPIAEMSEENADGDLQVAAACLYGANGQYDAEAGTWTFDLTSAARQWASGDFDMHGIYLQPTGAPNLAFGDPDTSTNARITLDVSSPLTATVASSEPTEVSTFPGFDSGGGGGFESTGDNQQGGSTGGFDTSVSSPATSTSDSFDSGAPAETAPPAEVAPEEGGGGEDDAVALDSEPIGAPATGWRVWLLLPVFALGGWLMIRSLTEDVAVSGAAGGAMTRLVRGSA